MNLVPVRPPGPNARKARAFASEILQLRAQGYTFEAIREALAGAGVQVSNSTVQREVARAAGHPTASPATDAAKGHRPELPYPLTTDASSHAKVVESPAVPASRVILHDRSANTLSSGFGGKEHAEAFFDAHPSNPLFSSKETS